MRILHSERSRALYIKGLRYPEQRSKSGEDLIRPDSREKYLESLIDQGLTLLQSQRLVRRGLN